MSLDAAKFAEEWIASWNAHDVERILSHYAETVEYHSPFIVKLGGSPDGLLHGKAELRAYIQRGLVEFPELKFTLLGAYEGVNSVVLNYQSVRNLVAAETFVFNAEDKVAQVFCHYQEPPPR
jgi:hypothetical protein